MHMMIESGQVIDWRYILRRQLGKGGMGAVYEAYDRLTGETVALKLVTAPPSSSAASDSDSGGLNLYLALAQEFKTLASLRHPKIISVLNYGFDGAQRPYFTMDLLQNAQSPARASFGKGHDGKVDILVQILQALSYLHRREIIHRDLKPANVRVVGNEVKVLDFGLSVIHSQYKGDGNRIVGTIEYMAPELLRQAPPSIQTDLYAVGVMAYELFTGKYLFDSEDIRELARQIFNAVPDLTQIGHAGLGLVVGRLLAKNPEDRYESADETIEALCDAIGQPVPIETAAIRESFLQAARLVGRDEELRQLSEPLERAAAGEGSAWLIGGESGVGKSRLMEEVRIRALVSGMRVLRGEAISQGRSPFQIWTAIIRALMLTARLDRVETGILQAIVPDIEKLLDLKASPPEELSPQAAQRRLIALIEKVFRAQPNPMLVVLEDLQWEGAESFSLLNSLLPLTQSQALMIVASYRDDEMPDLPERFPQMRLMKLRRMGSQGIADLAGAMIGERGRNPGLLAFLEKETEGNVFFLVEVMRALAQEVGKLEEISNMSLPQYVFAGGIERIIQRRLNRLPDDLRPMLELAAIMGRYLDVRVLGQLLGNPETVERNLATGANLAVLDIQDGSWRFAHEKLRDGMLASISHTDYAPLNLEVAAGIESVYVYSAEKFSALAHHWGAGGDREKEGHYAALAGEQALNSGGYEEAIRLLKRALELMPHNPDPELAKKQANLTRQLGAAYQGMGQQHKARNIYLQSLMIYQEVDYKWGIAQALTDLGNVTYNLRDYENSFKYYREAIQTAMSVRAQKVAIAGLIGIAGLMTTAERYEWAAELIGFALDHVATDLPTVERANELMARIRPELPTEALEAALAIGRDKRMSEIAEEVL